MPLNTGDDLTEKERAVVDELMGKIIDHARSRDIDVMGIDDPAVAVRESLSRWLVAVRKFPRIA